jgi:hypothetical protein
LIFCKINEILASNFITLAVFQKSQNSPCKVAKKNFGLVISGNSKPNFYLEKFAKEACLKNDRIWSRSQQLGKAGNTEGSEFDGISIGRVENTDIMENLKEPKNDETLRKNFILSKKDGIDYVWDGNQNAMLGPLARAVVGDLGQDSNCSSYFGKGLRIGPLKYQSEKSEKSSRKFVTFMTKDKDGNAKEFSYVKKGYSRTPRAKADFMMGRKMDKSFETNCIFNPFHYGSEKLKTGGIVTDDGFTMDFKKIGTSPSRVVLESFQSGMLGNSPHQIQAINLIPGSTCIVKQIITSSEGIGTGDPLETAREFGQTPSIKIEDFTERSTATPFGQPMPIGSFRNLFLNPNSKLGCTRNSGFANDVSQEKSSRALLNRSLQKSSRLFLDTPGLENSR